MKKQLLIVLSLALCGAAAVAQPRSASAPRKLLSASTGLMAPVWSPSGDKIAVTTDNYTGILVADADGANLRVVTDAAGAGYKMTWATDGKSIVGRTNIVEAGRTMHEIKQWDVATGRASLLVAKSRNAGAPTLKAAGLSKKSAGVYDIMTSHAGEACSLISALNGFGDRIVINPALSPDGTKIAFQVAGKGMWLINADGTGLKSLGTGSHPAWMPDSRSIVYTVVSDNGSNFTASELRSMNVDNGKSYSLLSQAGMLPLTPAVSPDGKKAIFENAADAAIYIVNLK